MVTFNTSGVFNNVSGVSGQWKTMPFTFTIPIDMNLKCNISYTNNSNITPSEVTEVQLESGSIATPYSPYTANPIELCKIGSYVDKLKRAEGKQLFNKDDVENDKRLDSSGQATGGSATGFSLTNYIEVEPNTTYTYSRNTTSSSYYVNISEYTSDKTHIQRLYSAGNTTTTYTFTTPNNCYYLRINDATTNLYSIMLNEGSTALPYEPYGVGKWYIEKNIGKVVYNGTENWYFTSNCCYTNNIVDTVKRPPNNNTKANIICDHYQLDTLANCYNNVTDKRISVNNSGYLYIYDTSFTSANAIKTWLTTNNVTVYYALATPSYETITNENLIQQLNNIQDIELYEDLCYVDFVGNVKADMTLLYAGTEDLGIKYIITEDGKKIRTDWRKLGRRKKWMMK